MLLKTDVDRFLEMVNERGKISSSECSRILEVEKHVVEKWAEILHENDLIHIGYGIRHMVIRPKNNTKLIMGHKKSHIKKKVKKDKLSKRSSRSRKGIFAPFITEIKRELKKEIKREMKA
ncbi:MAG: hypothetical protein J7K87_03465 [Candidatus Aenigmarchaeota archaeon]|nr:hypothetical protein [Candidatus Aenigmarchaeota archaeon]